MISAGRVLIIPKGAWSNLETYEMLDLVSLDGVSYIGRKQSVGVNPSTDTQMQYWQPFGTAAEIATTEQAGLVMPDGSTITIDENGLIKAVLDITGLDDVTITSIANGQILVYNSTTHKWENKTLSAGMISYNNETSHLTSNKVQGAIDEVVTKNQTLETELGNKVNKSDIANNLTTTTAGKVLDATQGKALNDSISDTNTAITNKHKVSSIQVTTSGWTADTTSQSGSTLYKKSISLSHVYVDSPSVDIGAASGSVLPTTAQQTAYDLLQYVTVDGTTLYLYGSDIPTDAYYINVEGAD